MGETLGSAWVLKGGHCIQTPEEFKGSTHEYGKHTGRARKAAVDVEGRP